jgi:predicted GNAT family acetyltransferase
MHPENLIKLNLELENQIDDNGDLVPYKPEDSCLFTISKHKNGYSLYFRHDIPLELRERLKQMYPEKLMTEVEFVKELVSEHSPIKEISSFIGCYFTHIPSTKEFPDVIQEKKVMTIKKDGKSVSWAWAQEENDRAIELAVETLPEYQKRGYGRHVVAACANRAIKAGKIAFYSYKVENSASRALAKSLGVVQYAQSIAYS